MTRTHRFLQRMADAWKALGSAGRVAEAVGAGRTPTPSDLRRLGIGVAAFAAIHRS